MGTLGDIGRVVVCAASLAVGVSCVTVNAGGPASKDGGTSTTGGSSSNACMTASDCPAAQYAGVSQVTCTGGQCTYPGAFCSAGTVVCGTNCVCPANSTNDGNGCVCDPGFETTLCDGTPCSGSACNPNFKCAATSGGTSSNACSSASDCPPAQFAGVSQVTCTGGQCTYPGAFCGGGTVVCGMNCVCPAHSTNDGNGCVCDSGYQTTLCNGTPCSGSACNPDFECSSTTSGGGGNGSSGPCMTVADCPGAQYAGVSQVTCTNGICTYPGAFCDAGTSVCGTNCVCPAHSTNDGTGCICDSGYHTTLCNGTACSGSACNPDFKCSQ